MPSLARQSPIFPPRAPLSYLPNPQGRHPTTHNTFASCRLSLVVPLTEENEIPDTLPGLLLDVFVEGFVLLMDIVVIIIVDVNERSLDSTQAWPPSVPLLAICVMGRVPSSFLCRDWLTSWVTFSGAARSMITSPSP